jgi:hypothetical protein
MSKSHCECSKSEPEITASHEPEVGQSHLIRSTIYQTVLSEESWEYDNSYQGHPPDVRAMENPTIVGIADVFTQKDMVQIRWIHGHTHETIPAHYFNNLVSDG